VKKGSWKGPKYPSKTLVKETPVPWRRGQGPIVGQLGKGPIESACPQMGAASFQSMYQCKGLS